MSQQQHPNLMYTGLGLATVLFGFGTNALLRPDAHLRSLGFPALTEPVADKLNHALMRIWGIRNVTIGTLIALVWTSGDEKLMAKALCASMALPITDSLVSRSLIGGGESQHLMFLPVLGAVVAGLYGWFD